MRGWMLWVGALGCGAAPKVEETLPWDMSPGEPRRPPPGLALGGDRTVWPGTPGEITVSGAASGERVYLVVGEGLGAGPCPVGIGGACLGLLPPFEARWVWADDAGLARFPFVAPLALVEGEDVAVQGLVVRGHLGRDSQLSEPRALAITPEEAGCDTAAGPEGEPPVGPIGAGRLEFLSDVALSDALLVYDQHHPGIGLFPDGRLVAVWDEGTAPFCRLKAGWLSAEDRVVDSDVFLAYLGSYTPGRPDVAVGVGEVFAAYGDPTDIYLVRYTDAGVELGRSGPINVASGTSSFQGMPEVELLPSGDLGVVYAFGDEGGDPGGRYYYRQVSPALVPIGEERLLGTSLEDPSPPSLTIAAGQVVAAWAERTPCGEDEPNRGAVRVARLDPTGLPLGDPLRADQGGLDFVATRPMVAGDAVGRLAVVWRGQDGDRDGVGARIRFFDAADRPLTDQIQLGGDSPETANRVVLDASGPYAVAAWQEADPAGTQDIWLQVFSMATGEAVAAPSRLEGDPLAGRVRPAVAATWDGSALVVVVAYELESEPDDPLRSVRSARWRFLP